MIERSTTLGSKHVTKASCQKTLAVILVGVMPLAAYGLTQAIWVCPYIVFLILGGGMPPASALYRVSVTNLGNEPLSVCVETVNTRDFETRSLWWRQQRDRMGWSQRVDKVVAPNRTESFVIPADTDPRLGFVLVSACTQVGRKGLEQGIALYLLSWPWHGNTWMWRQNDSAHVWPAIPLEIRSEDLTYVRLAPGGLGDKMSLRDVALPLHRR